MNRIFSTVATAAAALTLTLASADALASDGIDKELKGSNHLNSAGKGQGVLNSKGHDHTHSNGRGHDNHQGNGYGHNHAGDGDNGGLTVVVPDTCFATAAWVNLADFQVIGEAQEAGGIPMTTAESEPRPLATADFFYLNGNSVVVGIQASNSFTVYAYAVFTGAEGSEIVLGSWEAENKSSALSYAGNDSNTAYPASLDTGIGAIAAICPTDSTSQPTPE